MSCHSALAPRHAALPSSCFGCRCSAEQRNVLLQEVRQKLVLLCFYYYYIFPLSSNHSVWFLRRKQPLAFGFVASRLPLLDQMDLAQKKRPERGDFFQVCGLKCQTTAKESICFKGDAVKSRSLRFRISISCPVQDKLKVKATKPQMLDTWRW